MDLFSEQITEIDSNMADNVSYLRHKIAEAHTDQEKSDLSLLKWTISDVTGILTTPGDRRAAWQTVAELRETKT